MQEDHNKMIVWPPVIVLQNAGLGRGADGKTIGLDNAEIRHALEKLIQARDYRRVVALYGRQGHLGVAFLVFLDSDVGYWNALSLHNKYKQLGFGRDDWKAYRPKPGDEKKELFGYLADLQDMEELDKLKKVVKRWRMESFREKVLLPGEIREKDSKEARIISGQQKNESDALEQRMLADQIELQARLAKLAEMDEELEAENRRGEEIKRKFDEQIAEQRMRRKREREQILLKHKRRDDEIRAQFEMKMKDDRRELENLESEIGSLKDSVEKQEKENQKRVKLAKVREAQLVQEKKEEHIAGLEEKLRTKITKMKEEQELNLRKLKEQLNKEMLEMYEKARLKKGALEHKIEVEQTNQAQNCAICLEAIVAPTMRMLYADCGHSCVCEDCFPVVWVKNKACPYCTKKQSKKPKPIPAVVYF